MRLPHWTVNGQQTSSQFDAWREAKRINTIPEFYFYNDEYDALDWTTEPSESWYQLCYERCISLRQRYKKLSLFYSAGRDSHHILRCFAHFKIPLDQLVLVNWEANPVRRAEMLNYIYPKVNEFLKMYPNTKVVHADVGPDEFETFYTDDWLERPFSAFTHGYFQPTNFAFFIKHVLNDDAISHGAIVGLDKPRLVLENGKYYSTVLDKTIEIYVSDIPNLEFFYYAPEMPKIHLKQAWMTLNHIERTHSGNVIYKLDQIDPLRNTLLGSEPTNFTIADSLNTTNISKITSEFLIEYCGNGHSEYYDDFCIASGRGTAWNIELGIQNGKSKYKNAGHDPVLQQILSKALSEGWRSAINFTDAFKYLKTSFGSIFNNGDPYLGTTGVYSKKYYMKDQN